MIGAMPAVAVRHERRRAEKRGGGGRRPSQLPLQLGRPGDLEATPSPDRNILNADFFIWSKVAALHAIVGSVLLGIVVLVVGLVQLSPGAEAAQHRYYLMGCGAALLGGGLLGALIRCICLHWLNRIYGEEEVEDHTPAAAKNGVSVVDHNEKPGHTHHGQSHHSQAHHGQTHGQSQAHDKPKLKTQASVGREVDTLIKQPSHGET